MSRFIELTDVESEKKCLIGVDHIICLYGSEDGHSNVLVEGGEVTITVAETYEQIKELLK